MQFTFFIPIIQLFYLDNGLTIFNIALLGVIWNITRIILEVPSGVLADKWGRKRVLIISVIFGILQITMLIGANNYWHFLLASAFSAVSWAFASGTNTALFYDTLKELKKEKEFEKLWARQLIYQQIPLIIAFVSSGFLFKFSHLLPFQLSLIFLIASLAVAITLKEPRYHKPIKEVSAFSHFNQSIRYIFNNRSLRAILIFTLVFSIGSDISYGYGQIYLNQLALPIVLFGIAYTFKSLLVTFTANLVPSLRKRYSYRDIFAFQIISITILFYIMALTENYIIGAACFILIAIPYGFFIISQSSYVNQNTKSSQRATIGSMFSFLVAITILILEPVVGYLADLYTMKVPFILIAILLSVYSIFYLSYERKKFNK